jgi:hypothetical protein
MTLAAWLDRARRIMKPAGGYRHHRVRAQAARHGAEFPIEEVAIELDLALLRELRALFLAEGTFAMFGRPGRGFRAGHWTTPALMAVNNRIARIERVRGRNAPERVT